MLERIVGDISVPLVLDDEHHQPSGFAKLTLESEVQPSNAQEPIEVTPDGIVMLASELHAKNALKPIDSSLLPSAKVTFISEVQS